jgi:hypothetical protein
MTGHEYETVLELTGIYGLHPKGIEATDIVISTIDERKVVELEFETSLLEKLYVTIRLEDGIIEVKEIFKKKTVARDDFTFRFLDDLITRAKSLAFKEIRLVAFGSGEEIEANSLLPIEQQKPVFVGYKVWGKFGFMMEEDDEQWFLQMMKEYGKSATNLFDLQSTQDGHAFWKKHGKKWLGWFDLAPGSGSLRIFELLKEQRPSD